MIIDFHTHIFEDSLAPRAVEALTAGAKGLFFPLHNMKLCDLLEKMDEAGIDKSVVQPVVTKRKQVEKVNTWAAGIVSDRISSFGGIFPNEDDWKEQIDFVCSLCLPGIKFHCEFQDFVIDSPRMLKIYDYAFEKGLIIIHHAGYDPAFTEPFRSSPKQFAHIMEELKGGVMVAAHFGGERQWEDVEKYLAGSDIYLDTSMGFGIYGKEVFTEIYKKHGADRILFATDSPWSDARKELEIFKEIPMNEEDRNKILSGNAERILGLRGGN